jgi:hypothetical protein
MKFKGVSILAGGFSLLAGSATAAAPIDGKHDLMCQPQHVAQCDQTAVCATVALQDVELPPQLRVSFEQKKLSAPESERTSPIHSVEIDPAVLVVQGSQNGRGWSMVIDRATGSLSGTIADAEGAFIVAGTCAAP